ncbi:MAG TPA: thioredoxin [Candidatus Dormibacteraeota bacterium]|nr:thioredoxin [Candidatus Dormibacteraeota bacterium]
MADLSDTEFQAGVVDSPIPVLADFWAPWCGPCRMVSPAVEKMASEFAGKMKVAKVNTDEQPELGRRFGVRSIPTLIVFEAGREKSRSIGARSASELRGWVEENLGAGHRS